MEAAEEREVKRVRNVVQCYTPPLGTRASRLLADLREILGWLLDPASTTPDPATVRLIDDVLHYKRILQIPSQRVFAVDVHNRGLDIVAAIIQGWAHAGGDRTSHYRLGAQASVTMWVYCLVNRLEETACFEEFNQRCYTLDIEPSDPRGLQAAAMILLSTCTNAAAGSAAMALRSTRTSRFRTADDEQVSVADLDAGAIDFIREFAADWLATAPTGGSCTLDALRNDVVEPFVKALLKYQEQRACKGEFNSLFGFGRSHSKTNKLFACNALIDSLRDETLPLDTRLCAALEQGQLGKITMGFNNLYAAIKNRGGQASLTGRG